MFDLFLVDERRSCAVDCAVKKLGSGKTTLQGIDAVMTVSMSLLA